MIFIRFSLIFLIGLSYACSPVSPIAPLVEDPLFSDVNSNAQGSNSQFINQLKSIKIALSNDENNLLKKYVQTIPVEKWYSETDFDANDNLKKNFQAFKASFSGNEVSTQEKYFSAGFKFSNSSNYYARYYFDTEFYRQRQKILVIKHDPQTKEFIIVHLDGRISNYQLVQNINLSRYLLIPEKL